MRLFGTGDRPSKIEVTVSNRTILRIVALVIAAYLALLAIQQTAVALELIFIAFFLALALNAPVQWLANRLPKKKNSRTLATFISTLVIVLAIGGFLASLVPPIVRQTQHFVKEAPTYLSEARSKDSEIGKFIQKYNLEEQVQNLSNDLSSKLKSASSVAFSTLTSIGTGLFKFVTVLVMMIMMLVEGPRWVRLGQELVPERHRKRVATITRDMYKVVKGYVNGQVTLAAIAAVVILPMFFILGISYPFALMVLVFICGLIPMIGHYIGATIVTVTALFHSIWAAIIILSYYVLYQQIENYLLQPKIQSNSTNLSPLLVFASVLVGGFFGGLLGALVAIPVVGCIRILLIDILRERDILPTPVPKAKKATENSKA